MKIYVLGSTSFRKEMIDVKNQLCALGLNGWIHPDYEAFSRGEKQDILDRWQNGEHVSLKREYSYLHQHYKNILESDAVLIVNEEKNGVKNYIGGNVLMEMGQAHVNNKKIFLLNNIPLEVPYIDEIKAIDPICLQGNLSRIKNEL